MPREILEFDIFISSPSDVIEERETVRSTVEEMNKIYGKKFGARFSVMSWESDVSPSFGADPQSVINDQIGDNYDVFIGILWSRFGSKTPRADSGTKEEFERALSRFRETGTPEIMVYFKDAPISPSKIDSDQLKNIELFKTEISEAAGLYSEFKEYKDFESSLRASLASVIQKLCQRESDASPGLIEQTKPESDVEEHSETDEELGYLDYVEAFESGLEKANNALTTISEATEKIGEEISEDAKRLEILNSSAREVPAKDMKRVLNRTSENLFLYSSVIRDNIPGYSDGHESAFSNLSMALALKIESNPSAVDDLESLEGTIIEQDQVLEETIDSVYVFLGSLQGWPKMTSRLNKARKEAANKLQEIIGELEKNKITMKNMLRSIREMRNSALIEQSEQGQG